MSHVVREIFCQDDSPSSQKEICAQVHQLLPPAESEENKETHQVDLTDHLQQSSCPLLLFK